MSKFLALFFLIVALIAAVSARVAKVSSDNGAHAYLAEQKANALAEIAFLEEQQQAMTGQQVSLGSAKCLDYSTAASLSISQCLKNSGFVSAIPRGYMSTNHVDPNLASNVANARNAGFQYVDTYMFPCPTCGNPAGQFKTFWQYFIDHKVNVGMVWIDIEGTQYWSSSFTSNQQFMNELMSTAKNMGAKVGIYSNIYQWQSIFGPSYGGYSSYPLWFPNYDNNESCSNFKPFGGWTRPTLKQFQGDVTRCGLGVDISSYC